MFRKPGLFLFSGEERETPTLLGSLDLRTETGPVSEAFCFLVFRIPDDRESWNPVIMSYALAITL
jgi:hypothetical protein